MNMKMIVAALVIAAGLGACREKEDRSGFVAEGVYTVQELENYGEPRHPAVGATVTVKRAVVTAIDDYDEDGSGRMGSIWIGAVDPSGLVVCGAWCGITIYDPGIAPKGEVLRVGDLVDVTGIYSEFLYEDDGTPPDPANPLRYHSEHLSEIYDATAYKTGEWLPVGPVEVEAREIQMEPGVLQAQESAESLEGVLVVVRNLTARSGYDSYGQFETDEGVMVEDDLYHYPCAGYTGDVTGTHFDAMTGVVTWFGIHDTFGQYKILPRGPEDIVPYPSFPECEE
jgi:hypothetical protein